ncbi:unnamed protein product [Mucor hiemalis]
MTMFTFELKAPLSRNLFIEPILSPYVAIHKKYVLKGSSDESTGSRERKRDPGRISDLAVNIKHTSYSQSIFVCEVKSAVYMQKHPYSHPDKVNRTRHYRNVNPLFPQREPAALSLDSE